MRVDLEQVAVAGSVSSDSMRWLAPREATALRMVGVVIAVED
ncbi:hypothetical protein [Thiohalocapsa marina]|nr:hypothetical protein [Thiohalocapsa marina]